MSQAGGQAGDTRQLEGHTETPALAELFPNIHYFPFLSHWEGVIYFIATKQTVELRLITLIPGFRYLPILNVFLWEPGWGNTYF